jgi:hypothetical protein
MFTLAVSVCAVWLGIEIGPMSPLGNIPISAILTVDRSNIPFASSVSVSVDPATTELGVTVIALQTCALDGPDAHEKKIKPTKPARNRDLEVILNIAILPN